MTILRKPVTMAENQLSKETTFKLYTRQILTALGPLLTATVCGMISGYSAVLLPQIKAPVYSFTGNNLSVNDSRQHEIQITTIEEESWIASAAVLPMAPGSWMAGLLMEKLGRKKSIMAILPLSIIGWLTVALATNFACIITGRLISGVFVGLLAPLNPVYISETSDPHLRGVLLSSVSLALCFGVLLVHLIGTWLHWRTTTYVCTLVPCISFVMCAFAQESPTWLLNKGRLEDAKRTWIYLRGEKSLDEYLLLEATKVAGTTKQHRSSFITSLREILSTRYMLLPLGIMCVFFLTSQFSGANVVVFYSVDLLADVTGPWTLCGELFPSKYRGVGTGFTSGFTFICFFIVVKSAPSMIAVMKLHGTFATYGVITLLATIILYFVLPETKDKTLQEIERCFDKKPKKPVQLPSIVKMNGPAGT